jgi:hypothetical protein
MCNLTLTDPFFLVIYTNQQFSFDTLTQNIAMFMLCYEATANIIS